VKAADIRSLYAQGVRAIITLTERSLTAQPTITSTLLAELGITSLHVPIEDYLIPNQTQVERVVGFIDQMQAENNPVLIHCYAGQGRTGTLLHAYYLSKGWSLEDAGKHVSEMRPLCIFRDLSREQQTFLRDYAAFGRTKSL
jgi:atypical dual specificity phosphatase